MSVGQFLNQPAADQALKQQQNVLSLYVNSLAAAHDRCSKASSLAVCVSLDQGTIGEPDAISVELPPVAPPIIGPFRFAIDGVTLPPGEEALLLRGGSDLLAGAKKIRPSASVVDVYAPIEDPYLSVINIFRLNRPPMWSFL